MKLKGILLLLPAFFFLFFETVKADTSSFGLTLKTDFQIWQINLAAQDLVSDYSKFYFKGMEVVIPQESLNLAGPYLEKKNAQGIDRAKLESYLEGKIAPAISREREDVTIKQDEKGNPVFEGHGLYGRKLDTKTAASLVKKALEEKIAYVNLPLIKEYPAVTVLSDDLKSKGITELYSAGETNFSGSPGNRINNIHVGLARFNGHLVAPGEEFAFGKVLGPVDGSTGFKKELVIKGDRTVPEYGGGLCQVSTTAYRAVLNGGFPITARRNHSYAVSYYSPIGLDATVYPPAVDMKFMNDSPGHILIQTFTIDSKAYYNFYGTRDARKTYLIGPYYSNRRGAPAAKTEYTTKLAPGEKQVLGHAVPGLTAQWYRQVVYEDLSKEPYFESIHSNYQSRPDFVAIGISPDDARAGGGSSVEITY